MEGGEVLNIWGISFMSAGLLVFYIMCAIGVKAERKWDSERVQRGNRTS